ncbi:hypothetical protein MMIC_P0992 [Mariprofundus micogutta]|uniref:Uncharacterized protein n=1 Tax=Mariprofundus micogutta TaxID=1921010 RepID=A0A1L8CM99_9PROT|nr:hypothetical protein MMIC_P0992 [Mariprofundus micogutta]
MDQQDEIKKNRYQNGVFIALIALLGLSLLITLFLG